ncbi:MAG TPA: RagB/SusD family nutrient uptake outer membrane protein [Gemmatimonadaceae bacterium]|nr:RagB/SusD family nutrient uptake outer membrane protein [Gemmatimonadaceae bacterium]
MTHIISNSRRLGFLKVGAFVLACAGATACSDFLVAENPGAVEEPDVNQVAYTNLIANGPIFAWQFAHSEITYWNAQFTDELFNRAVFVEEGQIDRREMYSDMSYINAFMYAPMQRARYSGEDAAARLKIILGDTASRDLRVARSLAYAGMGYVDLAEMECVIPIDLGVPKQPEEAFADAIARFQEAITIATAAKAYYQSQTPVVPGNVLAADSVKNFALVGAARAALNRNDKTAAIAFAQQVPADFVFWSYYTDNTTGQRNRTYERLTLGSNAYLLNTPFAAMTTDPRIPRVAGTTGRGFTPLSPPSYSTFNNTVTGAAFAAIMSVRVASGLEARYIIAEAQGPTAATLAFVNERRAAGLQAPVTLAGDALMAELRDQRSRDFYLDNHRLGDLRRYKKYYNVDLFPKGPYPGSTTGQIYNEAPATLGTASDCWPLPTNEINGNPNIPKG